uniref:Protein similar to CwfJ C-terminus 1 n=1 Tax=Candidatus Kentrum sp. LFY TaxID=2126342 RepID=A0A450X4V4_9GAMM|nr:MAG: Protein similar to CwfJ C-terminus 1 [Candidatus Kentron sp. LFY]
MLLAICLSQILPTDFFEEPNFIVIPDIAPLVEGHVLIVSVNHYPCFGAMSQEYLFETITIKHEIRRRLTRAYRAPIFFEHGPVASRKAAGVCIDHAHLHCLPANRGFSSFIAPNHSSEQISSIIQLAEYTKSGLSYLFYESRDGNASVYPLDSEGDDVPPQHLRHAAARAFTVPEWNWRAISKSPTYGDIMRPWILRAVKMLRH